MTPPKTENSVQIILIKSHLFFFAKTIGIKKISGGIGKIMDSKNENKLRNFTEYRELYKFSKSDLGKSKFKLFDNKLINNLEFENILTIQSIWIKFSIEMCENLQIKFSKIQELIEFKYDDVDYDRLNQDLEEGFWG